MPTQNSCCQISVTLIVEDVRSSNSMTSATGLRAVESSTKKHGHTCVQQHISWCSHSEYTFELHLREQLSLTEAHKLQQQKRTTVKTRPLSRTYQQVDSSVRSFVLSFFLSLSLASASSENPCSAWNAFTVRQLTAGKNKAKGKLFLNVLETAPLIVCVAAGLSAYY